MHGPSLAQRSGQTFQRRTEDVGKRTTMDRFTTKFPELDPQILEWFTEKSDQGASVEEKANVWSFYESRCNQVL